VKVSVEPAPDAYSVVIVEEKVGDASKNSKISKPIRTLLRPKI